MLLDLDAIFDPDRRGRRQSEPDAATDLPAAWHVVWDERAAIMEYDGGLPREQAEHLALLEVVGPMHAGQQG
jgi:hypothetical protein